MALCPCNSTRDYDDCCGALIRGARAATTAEELMRARYTAFAQQEIDYLKDSHDPQTRGEFDPEAAKEWSSRSQWKGFDVLRTEAGGPGDTTGVVEFIARYSIDGADIDHHEISEFRKDGDTWYFHDGKEVPTTERRDGPKIGRNDPCPCGSGKKFKKCCGKT